MCGIAGVLSARGLREEELTDLVGAMGATTRHRGPDGHGAWIDAEAGVGIAHRRLSIVDLSEAGHQPMASADGRFVITFNGEVYNRHDLSDRLASAGVRFRGHSDTEVLLEAVARWGVEAALGEADGMFALGLWDRAERRLILARDRFGEKPLYYAQCGSLLLFGSELKTLRAHSEWRGEIDREALALLLANGYIPAPATIYREARKLLPGEWATVHAAHGRPEIRLRHYWDAFQAVSEALTEPISDPDAAVNAVEGALKTAVSRQMVADVPVGAFLSGGVDSSLVVGVMQSLSRQPVRSFSIGFWEPEYNEAPFAKAVAAHLGTQHTELVVTPADALAVIPDLPQIYDEPFADSSQIPTYLLSKLTRQSVTVSLSGDGGDELFGGYERYAQGAALWRRMQPVPRPLRAVAAAAVLGTPAPALDAVLSPLRLTRRFRGRYELTERLHERAAVWPASDLQDAYQRMMAQWKDPDAIVRGAVLGGVHLRQRLPAGMDTWQTLRYLDLCTYMIDDVLVKVDRAAMRASLETRVPLLDPGVALTAWRIPTTIHRRDQRGKWVLRTLLDRYVPRPLIDRPKRGFAVPVAQWLRSELRPWAEELLDEARLRREGYFDPAPIRRRWQQHLAGGTDWSFHLWSILSFQSWLEATR